MKRFYCFDNTDIRFIMIKISVVYCVICALLLAVVFCVKVDHEKILSDDFISDINYIQRSWKAGRNFHKDSELRNLISIDFTRQYNLPHIEVRPNGSIPSAFDSRKEWPLCVSIGSVKAQGNCASSHAIVAASVFTDRLCVQKTILRSSSAEQLLSCCKKCGAGCFGGHIANSFAYMKKIGLVTGGDYQSRVGCRPYKIENCPSVQGSPLCPRIRKRTPSCYYWKCTNSKYKNSTYDGDKLKIKNVYAIHTRIDSIKSEILRNGPVSSTFTIYEDFFNYKRGVYYHTDGARVGEFDVKIIGWGRTKNMPYWIAVNSWGKKWGDQGTFKIRLGTNECDIESHILSGTFL